LIRSLSSTYGVAVDADHRQWTMRQYRRGDETGLVQLFSSVFGRNLTEEQWRWKLKARPGPVENVYVAVVPDGNGGERLVFQYAAIPVKYAVGSAEVDAMVSVDTMTAPEFRRRGLLTAVGGHAYQRWREAGIAFVIGLPNEQWGSRAAALGWRELFPLRWRVRPVRVEAMAGRRLGCPGLSRQTLLSSVWNAGWNQWLRRDPRVDVGRVIEAGEAFQRLWAARRRGRESPVCRTIVRDARWVAWRYLATPGRPYAIHLAERDGQPVGYSVSKVLAEGERRVGVVPELLSIPGDDGAERTLLAETVRHLIGQGVDSVAALSVPATKFDGLLARGGFLPTRRSFSTQVVPLRAGASADSWEVFGGDFDVV
jgi:GNAT superfamily N-acetyltransferase